MSYCNSKILFDTQDHELLSMINDVANRDELRMRFKSLLNPHFHPRGIKEMAAPKEMRIAYAMINLLTSLEVGKAEHRIQAMRSLRDEVLFSAESPYQKNTARVLLQIMKELVRSTGNYARQLELAHDFRESATGKPRIVRKQLEHYHLLEMPEEWNQIAFDGHVHDAHTKGRKTPTHLIMDAWIKGIRQLTVIYYNYIVPEAAEEVLEAADIMKMSVSIGISIPVKFANRYIRIIWVPSEFFNARDFLSFLKRDVVTSFMEEGRQTAEYLQRYIFSVLVEFNRRHRLEIELSLGIAFPELDRQEFLAFVGTGQLSLLHLAEFIHAKMHQAIKAGVEQLSSQYENVAAEERLNIKAIINDISSLDSEAIVERYLRPGCNPTLRDPNITIESSDVPYTLTLSPAQMMNKLRQLHTGHQIILNLSKLTPEDIIELLFDCRGMITHLEIFNLKDYTTGKTNRLLDIINVQKNINDGNVILLKRILQRIIGDLEKSSYADVARIDKFKEILKNVATLISYYKYEPLKSNIGSDSTGRSHHQFGMGLVVIDTLPQNVQRTWDRRKSEPLWRPMPLRAVISCRTIERHDNASKESNLRRLSSRLSRLFQGKRRVSVDWIIDDFKPGVGKEQNIAPLGGFQREPLQEFSSRSSTCSVSARFCWVYLNSGVKNGLKVLIGFIPAFTTFVLTKDWWLLAYFGAFIWFGITGLRNILQAVLGGGGIRRSPLLRWNNYVSWGRIADSLLFTGFSVPLLDYIVKTLLMDQLFGITVSTNPILLYAVIALANGLYISSHNAFRGLPKAAIFGNFFRAMLSIPLAIAANAFIGTILVHYEFTGVGEILQKWAAIISKGASDCVAGVIEGIADRYNNIRLRMQDYGRKWKKLLDACSTLELLYPESNILELLNSMQSSSVSTSKAAHDLKRIIIIHALDLLYFWMYQPRARTALNQLFRTISPEEQFILTVSQQVLEDEQEISRMFIDGVIGKNFAHGLSFYLSYYRKYLSDICDLPPPKPVQFLSSKSAPGQPEALL